MRQDANLVFGFLAEKRTPDSAIEFFGLNRLGQACIPVNDSRQWSGQPTGLVFFVAVKDDAIPIRDGAHKRRG